MKVAVCLSGQTRCFEECIDSLEEFIIRPLQADVFCHFWTSSQVHPSLAKAWYGNENALTWPPCVAERAEAIVTRLKPKVFYLGPQIQFNTDYVESFCTTENSRMQSVSSQHVYSMYYSIMMADIARKEWGEEYDCVIRCRADLKFTRPIESKHLEDLSKVYIPKEYGYGGQNDQFAFSSAENMHKYSKCFSYLETHMQNGGNFHPETILNHHLKDQGVPVENTDLYYELTR